MAEQRRSDARPPLGLQSLVGAQQLRGPQQLLVGERLSYPRDHRIEACRSLAILFDVERIARQRVAPQRILLVDLQPQQLFELDLRLLNSRLARKRSSDLG